MKDQTTWLRAPPTPNYSQQGCDKDWIERLRSGPGSPSSQLLIGEYFEVFLVESSGVRRPSSRRRQPWPCHSKLLYFLTLSVMVILVSLCLPIVGKLAGIYVHFWNTGETPYPNCFSDRADSWQVIQSSSDCSKDQRNAKRMTSISLHDVVWLRCQKMWQTALQH